MTSRQYAIKIHFQFLKKSVLIIIIIITKSTVTHRQKIAIKHSLVRFVVFSSKSTVNCTVQNNLLLRRVACNISQPSKIT